MSTLDEVLLHYFKNKIELTINLEKINNPVPHRGTKAGKQYNLIVCLNQNFCCFPFYQTQVAYAHLDQLLEKDLDEAVDAATAAVFYDDPLQLAIPYKFPWNAYRIHLTVCSNKCYLLHLYYFYTCTKFCEA